jgi:hypothetical protein
MASKREQVIAAVTALVKAALPDAEVTRNAAKAQGVYAGGAVFIEDGDPGEPDVDLSPVTYYYTHRIPLKVAAYPSGSQTREEVVDAMMATVGEKIEADTTLGGLCLYVEPEAPTFENITATGAAVGQMAEAAIIATYATSNPLT